MVVEVVLDDLFALYDDFLHVEDAGVAPVEGVDEEDEDVDQWEGAHVDLIQYCSSCEEKYRCDIKHEMCDIVEDDIRPPWVPPISIILPEFINPRLKFLLN